MEALLILGSFFLIGALIGLPEAIERWRTPAPTVYSFRAETHDTLRLIFVEDDNLESAWVTALTLAENDGEIVAVGPDPWPQT